MKAAIEIYNKENDTLKIAIQQKNSEVFVLQQLLEQIRQEHGQC